MEKLNLAVFNTQPPHLYYGGVERRIIETTKRLSNDVSLTVYSGRKRGFQKTVSIYGGTFVPCFSTDALYPLDNWLFNRTIANTADAIKADIYEAHTVSGYGFLNAMKKTQIKKPFIHTIHGVLADEYLSFSKGVPMTLREKIANLLMWRLAKLEKETAENASLIVTVSHYSAQKIIHFYGVDSAKIRVVSNGVDFEKFAPVNDTEVIKRQLGVGKRRCVLFVGSLIYRKGLRFLIEAARHVIKEFRETAFIIVGKGPMRRYLTKYLEKLNLSHNFIFLGDVTEKALAALYNCADVFAFPSIQEGLGIVLLEAQATKKPVVAFNVGGIREALLDKETGLLIKPNSHELANSILKLLADGSLREQMGRKGRAFVKRNFSWDICAQKMIQVYDEALAANT